jgi:hypothetical protein
MYADAESTYVQPGEVNCVVCAVTQAFCPIVYAPDHGSRATASPIVAQSRFGWIAATTGQLR